MRVSTKRILSILVGALFLLGALSVYFGLIRGEVKAVEQVRGILASKEGLLASQEQAVRQVNELIAEFKNFERLQETVNRAIPNGVSTIQALRQIEAIGRSANVSVAGIDFGTGSRSSRKSATVSVVKRLQVLQVGIRAEGSYESLKQFVKLLETSVRVADVGRLSYIPSATRGANDSITLEVEMYYQE